MLRVERKWNFIKCSLKTRKDLIILNMSVPDNRTSQYMRQKPRKL